MGNVGRIKKTVELDGPELRAAASANAEALRHGIVGAAGGVSGVAGGAAIYAAEVLDDDGDDE